MVAPTTGMVLTTFTCAAWPEQMVGATAVAVATGVWLTPTEVELESAVQPEPAGKVTSNL